MADSKEKKLLANDIGRFAEDIAAQEYIKKGYVILERNWFLGKTEIDIIAQAGDIIVFSEVKARNGQHQSPIEGITPDKRKRMMKAADTYIRNKKGNFDYRFDFVSFVGTKDSYSLDILEDAFLAADFF